MATTSFHHLLGRKLVATGTALTVTTGLVGGALLMGSGASADTTSTDTHSSVTADSSSTDSNVEEFRADLKDARELTGEARTDAVKKVLEAAKAGEYGDKVEKLVTHKGKHLARIWAHAPQELKDDLKEVREAAPEDRAALKHEIFTNALDGDYGDKAQKHAEKLKEFVDGK